jgi:choline kinase
MTTLVILAAGEGSRFGGPKQLTCFGRYNRTLMEYNICHAADAGFESVVIITNDALKERIHNEVIVRIPHPINVSLVIQTNDDLPEHCLISPQQEKPLGTAHAIWCARHQLSRIDQQNQLLGFAVINADDYYGPQAFKLMIQHQRLKSKNHLLVGFELGKTLSEHGSVNRGLCQISQQNELVTVDEIENIVMGNGKIIGVNQQQKMIQLSPNDIISMNCWLFSADIIFAIEALMMTALSKNKKNKQENRTTYQQIECHLPAAVALHLNEYGRNVTVITSQDSWFGLTYAADFNLVATKISQLINNGLFPSLERFKIPK